MATLLLWRHMDSFLNANPADASNMQSHGAYSSIGQRDRYSGGMALPSIRDRTTLHSDAIIALPPLLNSLSKLYESPSDEKLAALPSSSNQSTHADVGSPHQGYGPA